MNSVSTRGAPSAINQEASLLAAWEEFFAAVRRARGRAARQHGGELTLSQSHLLSALAECPGARIGELAEMAGVAPPTATRMLDGLEREAIVERQPSESDRRGVTVKLTPKGRRLLDRKHKLVTQKRKAMFDSLAPEEREHADHLLRRLAEVMDEL